MSNVPTKKVALDVLIREAVQQNISKTSMSFDGYVAGVTEHYFKNISELERSFNFQKEGDAWENNRKAAKKLQRYFSVDTVLKIPAVLLPSLVNALQEPWRSNAVTEIVELLNPSSGQDPKQSSSVVMKNLMKESNEALLSFLEISEDGLGEDATEQIKSTRIEILQLIQAGKDALGLIDKELDTRAQLKITTLKSAS